MRVDWLDIEQIPFNFHVFRVDPAGIIPTDGLHLNIVAGLNAGDDLQVAAFIHAIFVKIRRARPIVADGLVDDHLTAQPDVGGNAGRDKRVRGDRGERGR